MRKFVSLFVVDLKRKVLEIVIYEFPLKGIKLYSLQVNDYLSF